MINRPTVLVLGAGASIPYGYPSGKDLKNKIITESLDGESIGWYGTLGIEPTRLNDFINALHRSPLTSVDAFLERRPEFVRVGKIAIVRDLIKYEEEVRLFSIDNWYQYLFNKLNVGFEEFLQNKLSIITFNYDRSFEQFLFLSLCSTYGKSEAESAQIISKIPIIHVHGKMGDLPWESGDFKRKYEITRDHNLILKSSESIRIVHENDPNRDVLFSRAHKLLEKASVIYFLGFGYNSLNVQRLAIAELDKSGKEIQGTALHFGQAEVNAASSITGKRVHLVPTHRTILDFLRENATI